MIRKLGNTFVLDTERTTYVFRVLDTGHLEHLYYGMKITLETERDADALSEQHAFAPGNTNVYDAEHKSFSLEDIRLEMSSYGKGDIREPFVELTHADGSRTSDFLYVGAEIAEGKEDYETLPGSYDENGAVEHLTVTLRDKEYQIVLELHYYVYEACDVIARSSKLLNDSDVDVVLERLMSLQLDFDRADYVMTGFHGAWAREMRRVDVPLRVGRYVGDSYTGTSSNRANPFFMLSGRGTDENHGICYGFNLIYSGNHYETAEVSGYGKTRILSGINPRSLCWRVAPSETFEAPEAVMTLSDAGYNGMSQNMHAFVRKHIVRGQWRDRVRPVLLNSWEAAYFDINEKKLLALAKAAKRVGIELFVMDDGWFGTRDDDSQSLGDWEVNTKKLPNGLSGLCAQVKKLGLDFGIWVEPEMVNVNSHLYRAHPDWVLQIPASASQPESEAGDRAYRPHSEGRNQRILDLGKREVQDYIIAEMTRVFSSADISYVKWDMNRTFTDYFSQWLPADRQGETAHRYVMGLYRCMKELTEHFPHILFEGCAAGGNRFDLGILSYFPQIWASDDTDALCRAEIQTGYSYGYPMSAVSAHVSSCPNHQTLRVTPLETRFNIAAYGVLGYECNLCDMKREELDAISEQIQVYKKWRDTLQFGCFYRGRGFGDIGTGSVLMPEVNVTEWTSVSPDGTRAVGMLLQKLAAPNTQFAYYRACGLMPKQRYHFYNRKLKYNVKEFGDLVNTVSPIHIKQDSLAHNLVAKFVKMDGESEDYQVYGDVLMNEGVKLKQGFSGTGYNDSVRHFPDFASRLYFMES